MIPFGDSGIAENGTGQFMGVHKLSIILAKGDTVMDVEMN